MRYSHDVTDQPERHTKGTAFALWLAWIFGFCGIHRFYLGKPGTGLLYLLTFGLFGIGQIIDAFRMPALVAEANDRQRQLTGPAVPLLPPPAPLEVALTRIAQKNGGRITVARAVAATGRTFSEVEAELDRMYKAGYVDVDNDENTGAVTYVFSV